MPGGTYAFNHHCQAVLGLTLTARAADLERMQTVVLAGHRGEAIQQAEAILKTRPDDLRASPAAGLP